jgi:hypothetical protein
MSSYFTLLRYCSKYGPFFLCVIHKEVLCPSSGDINRLMIVSERNYHETSLYEELNSPEVNALRRTIAEVKLQSLNG